MASVVSAEKRNVVWSYQSLGESLWLLRIPQDDPSNLSG